MFIYSNETNVILREDRTNKKYIYIRVRLYNYNVINYYCMAQNFDGGKFWQMGMWKILTNSIMLTPTFINGWRDWWGKHRRRL